MPYDGAADLAEASFTFRGGAGEAGADWPEYQAFMSGGGDPVRESDDWSAEIRAVRLDGGILFDRRLKGLLHARDARRVAADGFDHFVLQLNLGGEAEVDDGGGFQPLALGEAILIDTRRPMRLRARNVRLLTASLARELVLTATGGQAFQGRRLEPARTEAFRSRMAEGGLSEPSAPGLLLELLTALAIDPGATARARAVRLAEVRMALVRDWVGCNLSRRELDPERAARACGLSRSTLYRLLAPHGGLMAYARKRRLARLEQALAGGDRRRLRDLAEAFGFADQSQMTRHFREAVGVTPGAYRWRGGEPRTRWAAWMDELR